ncbi:type II toxin-antitoxin system Phd/YefM family antitoxin [candidate division KSB1 bacterium]|nr:type II toxin-antitoxin system Phd/YefM family antitoxin [candidate division KSB1 bacterium]NIR73299.1 type II toxin-antitoxin system Phd/YefM family antitoxin [candidate division KSB1 bacterium]NIS27005.1 type II toxin-antitoxin system Phd/YefM family antitoxin [candidate division KSB1 bacterium]NIT73845.1 type II toxin-antitoxin system Phd/YefM family antitoxin [candidate division KSB1 bacterium]NIU27750.1 type II toxin-antitoxin system Phd/YefM family antitoxin [candidate division KSB1 ba
MSNHEISLDEIEDDLSWFLRRIKAGEPLVILKSGKPLAEIKPVLKPHTSKVRPYGLCKGDFTVPEDFDAPLPDNIIKEFEGQ